MCACLRARVCTRTFVGLCLCVVQNIPLSSSPCALQGSTPALNFNDTSMKIGADVSQLTESQVEESEKSRGSKIEYILDREGSLKLRIYL